MQIKKSITTKQEIYNMKPLTTKQKNLLRTVSKEFGVSASELVKAIEKLKQGVLKL